MRLATLYIVDTLTAGAKLAVNVSQTGAPLRKRYNMTDTLTEFLNKESKGFLEQFRTFRPVPLPKLPFPVQGNEYAAISLYAKRYTHETKRFHCWFGIVEFQLGGFKQ